MPERVHDAFVGDDPVRECQFGGTFHAAAYTDPAPASTFSVTSISAAMRLVAATAWRPSPAPEIEARRPARAGTTMKRAPAALLLAPYAVARSGSGVSRPSMLFSAGRHAPVKRPKAAADTT